jgi:hypothetical protein
MAKSHDSDFPPEASTFELRLLYASQLAGIADGAMHSSAWVTAKEREDYLRNACQKYRFVAALCEQMAVDISKARR